MEIFIDVIVKFDYCILHTKYKTHDRGINISTRDYAESCH